LSKKEWQIFDFEGNTMGFQFLAVVRLKVDFFPITLSIRSSKPTKGIADKNTGSFKPTKFFQETRDMGLIPNKTGDDIGFERHRWHIEAADDICYTIRF
jgi:dGTPase